MPVTAEGWVEISRNVEEEAGPNRLCFTCQCGYWESRRGHDLRGTDPTIAQRAVKEVGSNLAVGDSLRQGTER